MAECEKFIELSSEEIETIISEATPTNTKRATAWGVSIFKGEFFSSFSTYSLTISTRLLLKLVYVFNRLAVEEIPKNLPHSITVLRHIFPFVLHLTDVFLHCQSSAAFQSSETRSSKLQTSH